MKTLKIILRFIFITPFLLLRNRIVKWAKAKALVLKFKTLRTAIVTADKNKATNGRKNLVVYNTTSKEFEAIEKRNLKAIASMKKGKKSKAVVDKDGNYIRNKNKVDNTPRGKRVMDYNRVRSINKSSLYATK